MKILMISGKQGSGKSTLSDAVKEKWFNLHHKNFCTQIKFADVIYEMHDAVLKILHEYVDARDIKKDGPLLQLLGTEWGRKTLGEDIWVKVMQGKLSGLGLKCLGWGDHSLVIIDDCRFENEFDAVPNALKVRLEAPEFVRKKRCSMWRENTEHPSETGLDDYAAQGKFDRIFNTENQHAEFCATAIIVQLQTQTARGL